VETLGLLVPKALAVWQVLRVVLVPMELQVHKVARVSKVLLALSETMEMVVSWV
jgi:hypothetical protein